VWLDRATPWVLCIVTGNTPENFFVRFLWQALPKYKSHKKSFVYIQKGSFEWMLL
jgi:hypothetical protein